MQHNQHSFDFRYRLLCEKLGQTVYKIPDELWENYFNQFQIELLTGVKLESRPHGFTEDDTPVYCRTGKVCIVMEEDVMMPRRDRTFPFLKVATKIPFPEDIVRCHSVVQAWKTQVSHLLVNVPLAYSVQSIDYSTIVVYDQSLLNEAALFRSATASTPTRPSPSSATTDSGRRTWTSAGTSSGKTDIRSILPILGIPRYDFFTQLFTMSCAPVFISGGTSLHIFNFL